jgi:spore coat protein A, manganese oxidase
MITRRNFLKYGVGASAALSLPWTVRQAFAAAGMGGALAKYIQPLPLVGAGIAVAQQTPSGSNHYSFTQIETARQLHPDLPPTPIWAYDDGHNGLAGQAGSFGMAVAAQSGIPVTMSFTNNVPSHYPSWIPVDPLLTPFRNLDGSPQVRLMTHLHGGFVAADSDGNPAATPLLFKQGETQNVYYTNQLPQMPASLLWFHDHGLGTTRLNVFAGLAAAYILRDQYDTGGADNANGLPYGPYEIPLVIQDRQFNPDGTFLYPTSDIEGVTWIGEYFGNVMLVNGKVWPFLNVEPRMYRFRILNGCNARILNLDIGGPDFWQIGAEGGMWDKPVPVKNLVMAPAERADVLVDFSKFAGETLVMVNHKLHKPFSNPAPLLPQVMQIRVGTTVSQPGPTSIPSELVGRRKAEVMGPIAATRYITLNEIDVDEPTWFLNLNGLHFEDPTTDPSQVQTPKVGTVEDWVYINVTGDTHPMHTHLVTFQVVGRTPFNVEAYEEAFEGPNGVTGGHDPSPYATGPEEPPDPTERGFKDTVKANPGYFTRIRAKFDLPMGVFPPQKYVHHCHIVEHEDNDMMRPFTVVP